MRQQSYKKEALRHNAGRAAYAEDLVKQVLSNAGWKIVEIQKHNRGPNVDLIIERPEASYAVEIKAAPEGRSDRLIPIWSQAYLLARHANPNRGILVVVVAPRINSRAIDQLLEFAGECAPDAAVGIVDFEGLQVFRGSYLDNLNSINRNRSDDKSRVRHKPINLFSDLNQWMLKVLLAPSIAKNLLAAPRAQYENASQLAKAANVSVMSAFRFVEQLRQDGYLDKSSSRLNLVRKQDLFQKWLAASAKPVKEVPVKFILRIDPNREIKRILQSGNRCLALFAAADALGVGFVHGTPPYIYVRRIDEAEIANIGNIRAANKSEPPDLILREPSAPESVLRGVVEVDGLFASDVLQVWLDVSFHPSRGAEQARFIEDRIIKHINLNA